MATDPKWLRRDFLEAARQKLRKLKGEPKPDDRAHARKTCPTCGGTGEVPDTETK